MNAPNTAFVGTLALLIGSVILASSTSSVVTTFNSNSPSCVEEIPDSASIGSWSNSTMQGSAVTFSNGTEIVFPADACVRPVYSSIYALDLAIESNANFTRAENGSRFAPPAGYETCSQFAAQKVGASGIVCPPQGATFALYYQAYSCPGGASNVTLDTDCAPYVLLSFGLFGKTLIMPCGNPAVDQLRGLNVYVPDSNGTFDTSSVFVQNDTMLNSYECIETTQGTSTSQSVPSSQSVEGILSMDTTTSQGTSTSQIVSSGQSVEGGQPTSFETIGIVAAVAVVTGVIVMTRRRRG